MRPIPTLTITLLLGAAALVGCGGGEHHDDHAAAAPDAAAAVEADRYAVRGEITAIDGDPGGVRMFLHHEAIPDFRSGGEVVGMDAMTMGFAVATDVPTDGLAVGDKVAFEWVLGPDDPAGSIVRIERLDPAIELDFGVAGTPDSPDGEGGHEGHDG